MARKQPDSVDKAVGRNVRLHRMAAKLSQHELGRKIGVTFQQVQKYEKGTNRIGASRLNRISEVLDVPIPTLFDGVSAASTTRNTPLSELLAKPRSFRLARAFSAISDADLQRCLVELIEHIASQRD
jgi:transcriptional regulator with XRE-family HTH domain